MKKKKTRKKPDDAVPFPVPLTTSTEVRVPSVNRRIIREFTRNVTREQVIENARKNGEKPFGYVIDYIKDMYGLTKSEAWDTATAVCKRYKV